MLGDFHLVSLATFPVQSSWLISMQDESCLEEAMEAVERRLLVWATSFPMVQRVALEAGQFFINLLH